MTFLEATTLTHMCPFSITDWTMYKKLQIPPCGLRLQPNIGKTVSYATYHLDVERAEKAPAARNDILAKRFGIPMEGYTYFFAYEETIPHRRRDFWSMSCSLGADLSQGDDFCAFTFLFPLPRGMFGVKTRSYISSPNSYETSVTIAHSEGSLIVLIASVPDSSYRVFFRI